MARKTRDHGLDRLAKRQRAELASHEADRLERLELLDLDQWATADDYAPGCDAHDRWADR